MADNTTQGFTNMDPDEIRDIDLNKSTGQGNTLQNDPQRASEMGKKGAEAQPTEAKRRGGHNSHNSQQT